MIVAWTLLNGVVHPMLVAWTLLNGAVHPMAVAWTLLNGAVHPVSVAWTLLNSAVHYLLSKPLASILFSQHEIQATLYIFLLSHRSRMSSV